MGKLKISENLFLEKNELLRFQKFIEEEGWKKAIRSLVKQYGVVQNIDKTSFAITTSTESGAVDILPGLAYNPEMEAIVSRDRITLPLGSLIANQDKWIVIKRSTTNNERGKVSISEDGTLTGIDTEFTKVLRGQPNFPTKVRFTNSQNNIYDYEVVSITSDTNVLLTGNFVAESDLKYSVVGTFTPGFIPTNENSQIYEYDDCVFNVITSSTKPIVNEGEFIIGCVKYDSISNSYNVIVDLRGNCTFSIVDSKLSITEKNNPFVSLLAFWQSGGTAFGSRSARIEFIVEYAYFIENYSYVSSNEGWVLTINQGRCNAIEFFPELFPDRLLDGYIVLNRDNMKSVKISSQIANQLYIENTEGASELLSANSDLIIIPDFTHIEIQAIAESNTIETSVPFVKEAGIADGVARMTIELEYPNGLGNISEALNSAKVSLKYRMFSSSGYRGKVRSFNTAVCQDYINDTEISVLNGILIFNMAALKPSSQQDPDIQPHSAL